MSKNSPSFDNFFHMFSQPIQFDIDTAKLNPQLRNLQQQYHPDKLSSDDNSLNNVNNSHKHSAIINHAYRILSQPDSRANYLLELAGQEINSNASITDLDFLDDAMDMRIRLDEVTEKNDTDAIKSLKNSVLQRIDNYSIEFKNAYQAHNWEVAIDATQKLQFLMKLYNDMDSAIEALHADTNNDDDLYL